MKNTWNKLKDWFKDKLGKQPAQTTPKTTQTQRIATPVFKPQQSQQKVFTPPSQVKTIDATKTDIKPVEVKKVEPVKTQVQPNKLQQFLQKGMTEEQKRNEAALLSVLKEEPDKKIVGRNALETFYNLSPLKSFSTGVEKATILGQMLENRLKKDGTALAPSKFEKGATELEKFMADAQTNNLEGVARKYAPENQALQDIGLAADMTPLGWLYGAGKNAGYLTSRGAGSGSENLNWDDAGAVGNLALSFAGGKMLGNAAKTGKMLPALGKTYGKMLPQAAGMNLAFQGIENLTGQRQGISLEDFMRGTTRSMKYAPIYSQITDPMTDKLLGGISGMLAKKYPKAAQSIQGLIQKNVDATTGKLNPNFLTSQGWKNAVKNFTMNEKRALAEVLVESAIEPLVYADRQEEGTSYLRAAAEMIPENIFANLVQGGIKSVGQTGGNTNAIVKAAREASPNTKLYSGVPGMDIFDEEIKAYAKDLEGLDMELKDAGQLEAEEMSQSELAKFLKKGQIVDDTKTDLKQEFEEVIPQVKTELQQAELPKQELIDGRFKTQEDADRYNNRVQINKELNQFEIDPRKTYKDTELNPFQKALGSANFIAKRSGKVGQEMYVLNQRMTNFRDKEVGNANALLIPLVKGMNDYEYKNLDKIVLGEEAPQTEAGAELRDVWTNIANDIYARASNGNIKDLKGFIEGGYFPHQMKGDLLRDEFGQVMTNQRSNIGSFSKSREDGLTRDQYDTTAAALFKYIDAAYDNIAKNEFFGENNVKLYELADQATANRKQLQQIANIYGGDKRQVVSSGEKLLQNYSTTKISPLTAIRNLSQQMNVADASSWNNLRKTYVEVLKNPQDALEYTIRANEIDSRDASTIRQDMAEGNWLGAYLKTILFAKAEKSNRIIAVNGGIKFAEDQLVKAREGNESAVRELKRLGIDNIEKNWTKEELALTAGKRMSEATQFRTEGGELPTWARSTAIGRLASKLRTFGYKQTVFRGDQAKRIGQELVKGNLRPLASALGTLGIAAPIMGEILNGAKSLFLNRKRASENLAERYLNNISSVYTLGLLDDLEPLSGEYGEDAQINTIIGVNAGVLLDLFKVGAGVIKGLNQYDPEESFIDNILLDANKRTLLKGIPAIGNTLSNTLVDNAAVDNVWGGKNVGLTKDKKETYNDLLAMGQTTAAQKYKDENQYLDQLDEKKKGNFFQEMFGKKDTATDTSVPTNKEEKDKIKKLMKEGAVPTEEQINATLFDGKFADSETLKDRNEVYSALKKAMDNEDYTDEQKEAILASSGASAENLEYYTMASESSEVKLQEVIIPAISKMESQDEVYEYLYQMRYEVGDKRMLADTMLNYLRDRGYISSDMAKALKKVQYDEIEQEFWEEESSGSGSGSSYAKKMAKASMQGYKDLASLLSGFANKGGIGSVNSPVNYSQYAGLTKGVSVPNEVYKSKDWLTQIFENTRQKQDGRLKTSV